MWEDCDRPTREVYFETDARFASDLEASPNAFVVALFSPAMRHGESRIHVKGKDLLFIYGFDVGGHEEWDANVQGYELARSRLAGLADALRKELIPVRTNLRILEEDASGRYYSDLFVLQSGSGCLAAAAHAFAPRISSLLVPSSHSVGDLEPLGTHPLIDPNYSSAAIAVRHDGLGLSRLQKTRLVSEWPEGLRVLRVCADPSRSPEKINCGRCEKCLRTMLSLLLLGKLRQCESFEADDVTPSDIERLWWDAPAADASPFGYISYGGHHYWEQVAGPLESIGRQDLSKAIERKFAERRAGTRNCLKACVKKADSRWLGGGSREHLSQVERRARLTAHHPRVIPVWP